MRLGFLCKKLSTLDTPRPLEQGTVGLFDEEQPESKESEMYLDNYIANGCFV